MDDTHPEVAAIELGGKSRKMKLGPASLRLAEMVGAPVTNAELQDMSLATLSRLVWVSLLADDPDLTERDVMIALAQADNQPEIIAKATDLVARMMEDLDKAVTSGAKKKRARRK